LLKVFYLEAKLTKLFYTCISAKYHYQKLAMHFLQKMNQPQRHEGTKLKKCYAFFLCGLEPLWLNSFRSEAEKKLLQHTNLSLVFSWL